MAACRAQQNPTGLYRAKAPVKDVLTPVEPGLCVFSGSLLGDRYQANLKGRLLVVPEDEYLHGFEHRDLPHQEWAGEHVGKFIHAGTLTWATTQDPALRAKLDRVVRRLVATQESDGYLGTYPGPERWTSWDVWVHKYNLLGLLTYWQYTGDKSALQACRRVGDLLLRTFGPNGKDLNTVGYHQGMASGSVLEPIVLLYRATKDKRYLDFANWIVANYESSTGPHILSTLQKTGRVKDVGNGKAYEMLSCFNGLLEWYRATGDSRVLPLMERAWEDIVAKRLYPTGSASAGEHWQEDYHLPTADSNSIGEVCVTTTWIQFNLHLLRLTGNVRYAEQIERTAYNHLMGAQQPDGSAWSYYTPLDGHKAYSPATTCCLSSGPRGIALLPSAAAMVGDDGSLVINLYSKGTVNAKLPSGRVRLDVLTDFPLDGAVTFTLQLEKTRRFALRLRIPEWASGAVCSVNGAERPASAGTYLTLDRAWAPGDKVTLNLPVGPRYVPGDHEFEGRGYAMFGPLVLALERQVSAGVRYPSYAVMAPDSARDLKPATTLNVAGPVWTTAVRPDRESEPQEMGFRPFAFAGAENKSRYQTWLWRPEAAPPLPKSSSVFFGAEASASRIGNNLGDIADDDPATLRVTYDGRPAAEDWFAVESDRPQRFDTVTFRHGRVFHDGGWFDASKGKPRIEVKGAKDAAWRQVATLDAYPATTQTDSAGLKDGDAFTVRFDPVEAVALRIVGVPACGDNASQAFSSCAELQASLGGGR
jgi:DUF1680 family protein